MFGLEKDTFKLRVNIETTGDVCILRGIKKELKVTELKEKIEGIIGIPRYGGSDIMYIQNAKLM